MRDSEQGMRLDVGLTGGTAAGQLSVRPSAPPAPLSIVPLEEESAFYGRYEGWLDAFPTVAELRRRLGRELSSLTEAGPEWHREERLRNVYLLSCAISDSVDDHLAGSGYDFSRAATVWPVLGPPAAAADRVVAVLRRGRWARLGSLQRWRRSWGAALDAFLRAALTGDPLDGPESAVTAAGGLGSLLDGPFGPRLLSRPARIPAAFRTHDLTHHDVQELAGRLAAAFPDRRRHVLVVGLRTAGSYFAPIVRATLAARGYRDLEAITVRPKAGLAPSEGAPVERCAARGGLAVLLDESPDTGATLVRGLSLLCEAGVRPQDVVALVPVHPTRRDWQGAADAAPLSRVHVLPLPPEDWHKERLLERGAVEARLRPLFLARGYAVVSVMDSAAAESFNNGLRLRSEERFHTRLKRVYAVRLEAADGRRHTRFVLAKSVGWGWLGYHAFLAGRALSDFVPPMLALRDGILYTEWLPQGEPVLPAPVREELPRRLASYVAARVRALRLSSDGPRVSPNPKGADLLATALSGAYGWRAVAALKRPGLRTRLAGRPCPVPTLIDGKMRAEEWVRSGGSILKTDFEHHGMGKTEINVTDPAYDLAEAILHFRLSPGEEGALLSRYRDESGDTGAEDRLFLHKLLAGIAALSASLDVLRDPRLRHRHADFNRAYLEAREFLAVHAARLCGRACRPEGRPRWSGPVLVADVDGVLDKEVFGFPTTTAAGIEALRLLHAHGVTVALDTARTLGEVQEYCDAYGLAGGVAEYGGVAWDAVGRRTRVLVTPESEGELRRLAGALRPLPGVFLDDRYRHCLRVYAFEGHRATPLPAGLVEGLALDLGLGRLAVRRTFQDTAVVAAETDKGRGLHALLDLAGAGGLDTVAVGDSEADLALFRVASRSFAPRHISCRRAARLLGCEIARRSYQVGFLEAARRVVHPSGDACRTCRLRAPAPSGLWWELLEAADRSPVVSLFRSLFDPHLLGTFRR